MKSLKESAIAYAKKFSADRYGYVKETADDFQAGARFERERMLGLLKKSDTAVAGCGFEWADHLETRLTEIDQEGKV